MLTLTAQDVPTELAGTAVRVGWVGGGRERGETPWECVVREAHEEIGVAVDRLAPPATKLWDWETRKLTDVAAADGELLQVRNADGQGAVAYFASAPDEPALVPGDHVVAILLLPPHLWHLVEEEAPLEDAVAAGAEVIGADRLPPGVRLWLHPTATLRVAVPLVS